MNYTTLVADKDTEGSIKQWINNSLTPASVVLREAELFITKKMRVRRMITLYAGTLAQGVSSIDLDTAAPRYEEMLSLRRAGDHAGRIHQLDHQHFEERIVTDTSGNLLEDTPTICCVTGSTIELNVTTDQTYPIRMWYYGRPALLAVDNQTNFLTDEFPALLRHACLYKAFDYWKETGQRDHHLQMAMGEIAEANKQWDSERQTMELSRDWNNPR